MPFPRTRTTAALRCLTALGLVAWLAGLGCVLGCSAATASTHHAASQAHAAQNESHPAEQESHSTEQPDSCAAMGGHDCCGGKREAGKKQDKRSSVGADSHGGRTAMHCPLGGRHAADPARKVRVDTTPAAAAAPATQSPAPESNYAAPAYAADVLVRDRGSTYLRCCVFLI